MPTLGVLEARKRFAELLERAREGEETLISRHGHPVAALVPLWRRSRPQRQALLTLKGTGRHCWPEFPPYPAARRGSLVPLEPTASPVLGSAVAIDATALIPYLRGDASSRPHEPLLASIASGHWRGVLSMQTLMHLLQGPLRQGDEILAARYEAVFSDPAAWTLVSLTPQVALTAVRLQRPAPTRTESAPTESAPAESAPAESAPAERTQTERTQMEKTQTASTQTEKTQTKRTQAESALLTESAPTESARTESALTDSAMVAAAAASKATPSDSRQDRGPQLDPAVAVELASALHGGATAMISRDPHLLAALPLPAPSTPPFSRPPSSGPPAATPPPAQPPPP